MGEGDRLVGMLTDRDIAVRAVAQAALWSKLTLASLPLGTPRP